jgi:hypothetical protein
MMQQGKATEMFNKANADPDGDELSYNRNELQEEPIPFERHFFYHAPGVIERDECFPGLDTGFPEHAI